MSLNDCLEISAEIEISDTLDVCAEVSADSILNQEYYGHIQNHDNPHKVTAEQVGAKLKTSKYVQDTPQALWIIQHNRNEFPSILILDEENNQLIGDIRYISSNEIDLIFSQPVKGTAYLN